MTPVLFGKGLVLGLTGWPSKIRGHWGSMFIYPYISLHHIYPSSNTPCQLPACTHAPPAGALDGFGGSKANCKPFKVGGSKEVLQRSMGGHLPRNQTSSSFVAGIIFSDLSNLEPQWPLFLKVNQGLFQFKQVSFEFIFYDPCFPQNFSNGRTTRST